MEDYKIVFVIDVSANMAQPFKHTVSRLESVKKAVTAQIRQLTRTTPKRKIGLVLFDNVVQIIGSKRNSTIGNNLHNIEYLLKEGISNSDLRAIEQNGNILKRTINSLFPEGSAALGPALVVALGMLTNSRGSRIIVCTAGKSNVGIGAMNSDDQNLTGESLFASSWGVVLYNCNVNANSHPMDRSKVDVFYKKVTDLAKSQAVTISINSFDDCELSTLEILARETAGNVRRVSPTDLHFYMDEDISREIVATNTIVKVVVPTKMYVHQSGQGHKTLSSASVSVGNVTANSNHTICFDFGFRPGFQENEGWPRSASGNSFLPFQVQLQYQDKSGRKLTRVVSTLRELTQHRKFAKLCMNAETVVTSLVQTAAKHLLESRGDLKVAQDFLKIAREHKNIDKVKFKPELTLKLDMFILLLEKICDVGLQEEMSAQLSQMVKMSI